MICERPFLRRPGGLTQPQVILSEEARLEATPFPCGKCRPCRINRSRVWSHRILLEAQVHKENIFLTLTYDDIHLPEDGSLCPDTLKNFLKRFRYYLGGSPIRYYAVGEYGEKGERPHYHVAVFGVGADAAPMVEAAWRDGDGESIGFIHLSGIGPESARYISGYVIKGWHSKGAEVLAGRYPEFSRMSRGGAGNGGLGFGYVKLISEKLKKYPKKEYLPAIKRLCYGKSGKPLGRYLSRRLAELLGIPLWKFDEEFNKWQRNLFDKLGVSSKEFAENMVNHEVGKRNRMLKREEMFKQRRKV